MNLRSANPRARGFSLLEVVLAIGISVGLLLAVMYFYRQAADLRGQAVRESEKLRETRLIMQRCSDELRRIFRHPDLVSFSGDSNSIQFVATFLPDRTQWNGADMGRATRPETDLALIRYVGGPTRSNGFHRSAQALVALRNPDVDSALDEYDDLAEPDEDMTEDEEVAETEEAEDVVDPGAAEGMDATAKEEAGMADEAEGTGGESGATFPTLARPNLLTENIRFSRFRFWGGEEWQDAWSGGAPPQAVEISLGFEPLPEMTEPDQYPHELFRRVIYLGKVPAEASDSEDAEEEAEETDEAESMAPGEVEGEGSE